MFLFCYAIFQGQKKTYDHVVKANIGDAHALGMKPLTFPRQVSSFSIIIFKIDYNFLELFVNTASH